MDPQIQQHSSTPSHFRFPCCHTSDGHNKFRCSSPSIEETWITQRWPNRVFTYLLATIVVNTFLVKDLLTME